MEQIHFKMEKSAIDSMRPTCYFGSVDLSEAFYSILIRPQDRKFFRFIFLNKKYQFMSLVMGLASSPRVFTKVLKPIFASLRARGFISTAMTLWWFRLKDLSIDKMVGAWCFGCLSGPPGFTCWISFAPVFSLIYCWVLILALSPC